MGMLLSSASLDCAIATGNPVTTYPFTFGCWFNAATLHVGQILHITNAAAALGIQVWTDSGGAILFGCDSTVMTLSGAYTAGGWHYVMVSASSAADRRFAVVAPNGSTALQWQNGTAPISGLDRIYFGGFRANSGGTISDTFNGTLAEMFLSNSADWLPSGTVTESHARWLAYRGPLSIPSIRSTLVQYRAFRHNIIEVEPTEVHNGTTARLAWSVNGTPKTGPNPPTLSTYVRPSRPLVPLLV